MFVRGKHPFSVSLCSGVFTTLSLLLSDCVVDQSTGRILLAGSRRPNVLVFLPQLPHGFGCDPSWGSARPELNSSLVNPFVLVLGVNPEKKLGPLGKLYLNAWRY